MWNLLILSRYKILCKALVTVRNKTAVNTDAYRENPDTSDMHVQDFCYIIVVVRSNTLKIEGDDLTRIDWKMFSFLAHNIVRRLKASKAMLISM